MSAERITRDTVEAAVVEFDAQDRAVVAGQVVMTFGLAGVLATEFAPRLWEEVAAYLYALTERAPLKSGAAYLAHRTLIGAFAFDLRQYARIAGEPVGLEVDLRGATSKAEERRIRERIADQEAALDRHLDDVIHQHRVQTGWTPAELEAAELPATDELVDAVTRRSLAEEDERMGPEADEPPAAPDEPTDDQPEYLL